MLPQTVFQFTSRCVCLILEGSPSDASHRSLPLGKTQSIGFVLTIFICRVFKNCKRTQQMSSVNPIFYSVMSSTKTRELCFFLLSAVEQFCFIPGIQQVTQSHSRHTLVIPTTSDDGWSFSQLLMKLALPPLCPRTSYPLNTNSFDDKLSSLVY